MLRSFVDDWNRERPPRSASRFAADGRRSSSGFVGAVAWVAQESGLPTDTIENVMKRRTRTTELRIADPIVQALGHPFAFYDGTLPVRENPMAPRAARASCCGGSLTGVG